MSVGVNFLKWLCPQRESKVKLESEAAADLQESLEYIFNGMLTI